MPENMQFVEISADTRTYVGNFYAGEIRKVPAEVAGMLIGNGWAESVEIAIEEKGAAEPDPVTLEVDSVRVRTTVEDAG